MTDDPPLPWNAKDIAEHIAQGHRVKLGNYVFVQKSDDIVRQHCERCDTWQSYPFTPTGIILCMEEAAKFILKHQHKEPPS